MVSLSIVIPTAGRDTLVRALRSCVAGGLGVGDQIVVACDGRQDRSTDVFWDGGAWGDPGCGKASFFNEFVGDFGASPRNAALRGHAGRDYIVWMDDDDAFTFDALNTIRRAAGESPGRPMMFKFVTPTHHVLWQERRLAVGRVGGHQFVTPNVAGKLGVWGSHYCGDFDFIASTMAHYDESALVWRPEIIAITRPW